MKLNYDMISLFLIIFIFYYLLFIISNQFVIEGNENVQTTMCSDFDKCNEWPYLYKDDADSTPQCSDNTDTCSNESKIAACCNQRAQMCQGNIIGSGYIDYNCSGNNLLPKIEALELPRLCGGDGFKGDCWDAGNNGQTPPGLQNCPFNHTETCNLGNLLEGQGNKICCTSREIFEAAQFMWGKPHLISEANLKYMDLLQISNTKSNEYDKLLNEALSYLNKARDMDDEDDRNITELINDWGSEINRPLGSGMCRGNIDRSTDYKCSDSVPPKQYIENSFITEGQSEEKCCVISGMCKGNTNLIENIECPENMHISNDITLEGSTIQECCEEDIKCRGNENIYLNYDCPEPMIPVIDTNNKYGNTEEECCRFPGDKDPTEINPHFENETIQGTITFNGDLIQSAGDEDSSLRNLFEEDFKKDLINIFNEEKKITIVESQIKIKKIYTGSIIIDFEVEPDILSTVSISKDYFSYLLSGKLYFPTIKLHTSGSVTNVGIVSWDNINHWPNWIWYVIISLITFMITILIIV